MVTEIETEDKKRLRDLRAEGKEDSLEFKKLAFKYYYGENGRKTKEICK